MKKFIAASIIGLSIASTAFAESRVMGIADAIQTALERNPTLRKTREMITQAQAQVSLGYSTIYPNLSAELIGQKRKDAVTSSSVKFRGDSYNQYSFGFTLAQPLFTLGILDAINVPKMDVRLRSLDVEIQTRDLTASVIQTYYQVVLNQRLLESLLSSEGIEKEALSTAQRRYQIGRGQLLDVLQVKTQLALINPKIADARNQVDVAIAQLSQLLSLPQGDQLALTGKIAIPQMPDVEGKQNSVAPRLPEFEKELVSGERLRSERSGVLGKHWPSLALAGTWDRYSYTKSELLDAGNTSWTIGLQLTIPLFSGLSSVYERRTYDSREAQLDFEQTEVANQLSLNQIRSRENLTASKEKLGSSEEAFKLADSSLKEAKKNYRLATIDFLQFLSVQQAYLEAESSMQQARYNYITSLVSYFVSTGLPLDRLVSHLQEKSP